MEKGRKSVSDLGSAAYMLLKGFKVVGKRGKEIYFEISEENNEESFDQLTMDYLSSEFHRFDSCIMSLKKIGEYNFDSRALRFVTDLGAAAYLLMHKYKVVGRRGKSIYFDAEDDAAHQFDGIALEYLSSEFHHFDSCLMSLKKIGEYIQDEN